MQINLPVVRVILTNRFIIIIQIYNEIDGSNVLETSKPNKENQWERGRVGLMITVQSWIILQYNVPNRYRYFSLLLMVNMTQWNKPSTYQWIYLWLYPLEGNTVNLRLTEDICIHCKSEMESIYISLSYNKYIYLRRKYLKWV